MTLKLDANGQEVIGYYLGLALEQEVIPYTKYVRFYALILGDITPELAKEMHTFLGPLFRARNVKEVQITNIFGMFAICA